MVDDATKTSLELLEITLQRVRSTADFLYSKVLLQNKTSLEPLFLKVEALESPIDRSGVTCCEATTKEKYDFSISKTRQISTCFSAGINRCISHSFLAHQALQTAVDRQSSPSPPHTISLQKIIHAGGSIPSGQGCRRTRFAVRKLFSPLALFDGSSSTRKRSPELWLAYLRSWWWQVGITNVSCQPGLRFLLQRCFFRVVELWTFSSRTGLETSLGSLGRSSWRGESPTQHQPQLEPRARLELKHHPSVRATSLGEASPPPSVSSSPTISLYIR